MKQFFKSIFVNREQQVRSGWKIGLVLVLYMICMAFWMQFFPVKRLTDLRYNIVDTLVFVGVIIAVLRLLDRKPLNHIGLTGVLGHFWDLGFGLVFGLVSIGFIFVILMSSGQIGVERVDFSSSVWSSLGNGLLLFVLVGFREELFSRSYCLFVFGQMRRVWLSVLLSAIFFTLFHAGNPNLQPIGLINIFLAALLFTFMTIKTGNLWMAIGYHITWNYFQGSVFGFPVSGVPISSLIQIQIGHNNWLTGGPFGPEAGLLGTGTLFAGFIVVWLYTKGRENTFEPFYKPKPPLEPLPAIETPEKHKEYC